VSNYEKKVFDEMPEWKAGLDKGVWWNAWMKSRIGQRCLMKCLN